LECDIMNHNCMFDEEESNVNQEPFEDESNPLEEEESNLDESNLDGEDWVGGTDLNEIFTPEEIEEYLYNQREPIPFSKLSNSEKGVPLERVIRRYCISMNYRYGLLYRDLARNKNRKGAKGKLDVDFVINEYAAIEAKNWDCFAGKQYVVCKRDLDNQVLNKFTKYKDLKKILVIAKPWWERGAEKYLYSNKVEIIEVGFQVTYDTMVQEAAFWKIKPQLDTLLYFPYPQLHRIVFTI